MSVEDARTILQEYTPGEHRCESLLSIVTTRGTS